MTCVMRLSCRVIWGAKATSVEHLGNLSWRIYRDSHYTKRYHPAEFWHRTGLKVEDCRLQTADRLIHYLSVMSIVAWRIFWLTLVSRVSPNISCEIFLGTDEWKILYARYNKNKPIPKHPPTLRQCVRWIARFGGFLGRESDGEPGITHVWRGLKKYANILEGVALARDIYG